MIRLLILRNHGRTLCRTRCLRSCPELRWCWSTNTLLGHGRTVWRCKIFRSLWYGPVFARNLSHHRVAQNYHSTHSSLHGRRLGHCLLHHDGKHRLWHRHVRLCAWSLLRRKRNVMQSCPREPCRLATRRGYCLLGPLLYLLIPLYLHSLPW